MTSEVDANQLELFRKEAEMMQSLRPHANVIQVFQKVILTFQYYGICCDPNHPVCIILEYMPEGSLVTLLHSSKPISNAVKLRIISGIASGMLHLSEEGIVHRDLAARNILV